MSFANIPNPTPAYVDGNVPFASFAADIKRGTQVAAATISPAAIFEGVNFTTPGNRIGRPNQITGPNGNVLVKTQETSSGTVQLATPTTEVVKVGDWYQIIRDGQGGGAVETWVFDSVTDVFEPGSYRKHSWNAFLAHNPA